MLRFVSKRMPVAAAAAAAVPLVRFQSSAVVGESLVARPGANRRVFPSAQVLPRFEIHDVRDVAAQGSMTRVAVDGKLLLISQFPQLGPRKADPNDTTPQFDRERRVSLRFRHMDLAGFVCVVEDRLPSYHVANNAYELTFEKTPGGYVLKGEVHRSSSQAKEDWSVRFENQFAVTMEHFLQSALTESFGFLEHQHMMAEQARRNNNNNQNRNRDQNRRRNDNNNNNRANNRVHDEAEVGNAEGN
ncbi:mitochondrial RNA binding protein 1 gBP21 MRP1 [Lotmaria passim]